MNEPIQNWYQQIPKVCLDELALAALVNESDDGVPMSWAGTEHDVWLQWRTTRSRGSALSSRLPGKPWHRYGESSQLVRVGNHVPSATLPALDWQPLREGVSLAWPIAKGVDQSPLKNKVELSLGPSHLPTHCNALWVGAPALTSWIESVSQSRLRRIRWTVMGDEALLLGDPLPPLDGTWLSEKEGVFTPAGWEIVPRLEGEVIRQAFGLEAAHSLIWLAPNRWVVLPDDACQVMTRGSVRTWLQQQ